MSAATVFGRLSKVLDMLVDLGTAVCFLVMSLALAVQVVFRYVLNRPLVWPEELSLLFFVWFVWLGGAGGIREERQIRVDIVEVYAPPRLRRVLEPVLTLIALTFLVVVVVYGVAVTGYQRTAEYDTLPFSRAVLYAVAPVMGSVMIFYLLRILARELGLARPAHEGSR